MRGFSGHHWALMKGSKNGRGPFFRRLWAELLSFWLTPPPPCYQVFYFCALTSLRRLLKLLRRGPGGLLVPRQRLHLTPPAYPTMTMQSALPYSINSTMKSCLLEEKVGLSVRRARYAAPSDGGPRRWLQRRRRHPCRRSPLPCASGVFQRHQSMTINSLSHRFPNEPK